MYLSSVPSRRRHFRYAGTHCRAEASIPSNDTAVTSMRPFSRDEIDHSKVESSLKSHLMHQPSYSSLPSYQGSDRSSCSSPIHPEEKLVIVMVGLPARGKSYLAKKVNRFLNWSQHSTKIFNVGEKRREVAATLPVHSESREAQRHGNQHTAGFFSPNNEDASRLREELAMVVLDDLLFWLAKGGCVGVFDATNTTVIRRDAVVQRIRDVDPSLNVLFLETQCLDQQVLECNMGLKLRGPDYKNEDPAEALTDFKQRVAMYEVKYNPIGEHEEIMGYSYCQIIDVGRKCITYNIHDYLSVETVAYLQNFHLYPRQIWLCRHGESEDDIAGRLGGDSCLSKRGHGFAKVLPGFISHCRSGRPTSDERRPSSVLSVEGGIDVWTSITQKSVQTAEFFQNSPKRQLRALDEMSAGSLEGFTREDVRLKYADWFEQREFDKFSHRYPGSAGEGYSDVSRRLRNVILEIERTKRHTLVISGLAVTRVLIAYFLGLMPSQIPSLEVPQGQLYMFEPRPYGIRKVEFAFDDKTHWFHEVTD